MPSTSSHLASTTFCWLPPESWRTGRRRAARPDRELVELGADQLPRGAGRR